MNYPDFSFEEALREKGYTYIIGVDEVGRGAFAGPVVAGAASLRDMKSDVLKLGINDSKKLTAKRREELDVEIRKYFCVGIGEASVDEINMFGIVKATEKAMKRAIATVFLSEKKEISEQKLFLLIDAFHIRNVPGIGMDNQKAIIGGDGKSVSIAAASIVAKVYRDSLMTNLSADYVSYRWDKNKGYGTVEHREEIQKNGLCKHHRTDFVDHLFYSPTSI